MKLEVGMKVKVKPLRDILNHISCNADSNCIATSDEAFFNIVHMSKFCETTVIVHDVFSDESKYNCRIKDSGHYWAFAKEWLEEI